jgi:hypothetical protein
MQGGEPAQHIVRLGDLGAGQGGDGQRAAGDPLISVAGQQLAQGKTRDCDDVQGQAQDRSGDCGDKQPGRAVPGGQGCGEHRETLRGHGEEEGLPGHRVCPWRRTGVSSSAQLMTARPSRASAAR